MILRPYQAALKHDILSSWATGSRNVLAVLPTAGGKTVLFTSILADEPGISFAIAHRKELVSQMAITLNKRGIRHFALAPESTVKWIISQQIREHGRSFYDPAARCAVAGVDTILSRKDKLAPFMSRAALWITDEAHHLVRTNKWGKAVELLPNARGLGVTATPERADGKGLGRHADGVMDVMVLGPTARELIDLGYLTGYRIFAPPSDVQLDGVDISPATGDYNQTQLIGRVRKSHIVGDVVAHYLRITPGKLGITFATDVETAGEIAVSYRAAGVPAEMVSAKTPDAIRAESVRRLRNGDLKQLVNVDIFGEGFDLPAIEVVSMARPTASYVLFCQQFGRTLRTMDGKEYATIIDHVGNVMQHGIPDAPRIWTLDARERRTKAAGTQPLRSCPHCTGVYEAFYRICPYCQHVPVPAARSRPEFVDGDLVELDPAVLAVMRQEVIRVDEPSNAVRDRMLSAGAPHMAALGAAKQHRLRQEAQQSLRTTMSLWGGWQNAQGRDKREGWRRFFHRFGVDVLTAQALGRPEAERLEIEINKDMEDAR